MPCTSNSESGAWKTTGMLFALVLILPCTAQAQYRSIFTWQAPSIRPCAATCHCPVFWPTSMYCDGRNLHAVPPVPARMRYIYLQNNHIEEIHEESFKNATSLVWLFLERNRLTSKGIASKAFAGLKSLEKLYLSHNSLTEVPHPLPSSLRDLRLQYNSISKVPEGTFQHMENLTDLFLNNNRLNNKGLPPKTLKDLTSLVTLELTANEFDNLPSELPASLQQFYIEENQLSVIPKDYLLQTPNLQYLRLAYNELKNEGIPPNTFNIQTLVELDLGFNQIENIPRVHENLQYYYIEANNIEEVHAKSFCHNTSPGTYSQIRMLRLDGNKIKPHKVPFDATYCLRRAEKIIY